MTRIEWADLIYKAVVNPDLMWWDDLTPEMQEAYLRAADAVLRTLADRERGQMPLLRDLHKHMGIMYQVAECPICDKIIERMRADRQPYPTAYAYEAACAALDKHRAGEEVLRAALRPLKTKAGWLGKTFEMDDGKGGWAGSWAVPDHLFGPLMALLAEETT